MYQEEKAKEFRGVMLGTEFGYNLTIQESEMVEDEHYIVLDNTSLDYDAYSIAAENGNLYIKGSYTSYDAAVSAFYKLFDGEGSTLNIDDGILTSGKIDTPEIPYENKQELLTVFEYFQENDKVLFGQHLAGSLNLDWSINDYTKAVGEGPSIMDIDMISLRTKSAGEISSLVSQVVAYAAKGGIITTMHHWLNPAHPETGSYRGTLDSLSDWTKVLTKGTALNTEWHKELDISGEFLASLRDAGVSVVYRPMHEANGDWFWFCAVYPNLGVVKSSDMISMWKYVYNYYTDDLGLDNLVWCYGPNNSDNTYFNSLIYKDSPLYVGYYYPGDEYCDIVGMDWYTDGGYEIDGNANSWDTLLGYGKPTGLCEWGIGGSLRAENQKDQAALFSCENYVEILERMRSEGKKIAFAEAYAGEYGAPSYIGKGRALAESSLIVSLEEMPMLIKDILN